METFALFVILIIVGLAIIGAGVSNSRNPQPGVLFISTVLNIVVAIAAIYLASN